jgi:hypothetical protein
MAEWKRLSELAETLWKLPSVGTCCSRPKFKRTTQLTCSFGNFVSADTLAKKKMASVAACAAWNMAKWTDMTTYVEFLPEDTVNGSFYRAVLQIHHNNFDASQVRAACNGPSHPVPYN